MPDPFGKPVIQTWQATLFKLVTYASMPVLPQSAEDLEVDRHMGYLSDVGVLMDIT